MIRAEGEGKGGERWERKGERGGGQEDEKYRREGMEKGNRIRIKRDGGCIERR